MLLCDEVHYMSVHTVEHEGQNFLTAPIKLTSQCAAMAAAVVVGRKTGHGLAPAV